MGSGHGWMGEAGSLYRRLLGNVIQNVYWEDLGDGKIKLKMDLMQIAYEDRTQLKLADDRVCWGDLVSAMLILWVLLTIYVNCRFKVFYGCFGFPLAVSCHQCLYFVFIHLFLLLKKGSKNHLDY